MLQITNDGVVDFILSDSIAFCRNTIKSATGRSDKLRSFADNCSASISTQLTLPLQRLKRTNPRLYAEYFPDGGIVIQLIFFGKDGAGLHVYVRDIFLDPLSGNFFGTTVVRPTDCEATCAGTFGLGYYEKMTNPLLIKSAREICHIISMEITAHPDQVGWPIRTLHLTASGRLTWFEQERTCVPKAKSSPRVPARARRFSFPYIRLDRRTPSIIPEDSANRCIKVKYLFGSD